MSRWLWMGWVAAGLVGLWLPQGRAETFRLTDGQELTGKVISADAQGLVMQKEDGSFVRTPWNKFTDQALKELAKRKDVRKYIEALLEPEEEETQKQVAREIKYREPPRLPRPDPQAGLGAIFSGSIGLVFLVLLYAANLYAAYEVALFRNYPWLLVCGLALILPVATQVVFLCMPTRVPAAEAPAVSPAVEAAATQVYHLPGQSAAAEAEAVTPAPGAPAHAPPQIYVRGQYTFNRRFFETKLAGFMKAVPGEAERDMVMEVHSLRGTVVSNRIARVMPNEVSFLVQKGTASDEIIIPFTEIREIRVRHKDA
jgi:hypothetical protein